MSAPHPHPAPTTARNSVADPGRRQDSRTTHVLPPAGLPAGFTIDDASVTDLAAEFTLVGPGVGTVVVDGTQAPFKLEGRVSGVRVLVLGAGLAGLTVAYELGKVGFDCRLLEARARHTLAGRPPRRG